jgi:hypothetical protein
MLLQAQAKREDDERKRQEAAARKAELKRLQEQEEAALAKPKPNPKANRVSGPKVSVDVRTNRRLHKSTFSTARSRAKTSKTWAAADACTSSHVSPPCMLNVDLWRQHWPSPSFTPRQTGFQGQR